MRLQVRGRGDLQSLSFALKKKRKVRVSDFLSSRRSKVVQSVRDARARIEIRDDAMRDIREEMAILNHARSSQSRVSSFAWPDFGPRAVRFQAARVRLTDPPARAAFFFGRATWSSRRTRPNASLIIISRPLLSFPRETSRRPITQKTTMGTQRQISLREEEKRIRHHDRALCDRTRPKRDRNETYRVCERKHGTCFSSVFVRRRLRASRFDILLLLLLFSALSRTIWIPRFDMLFSPSSFECLGTSKGKKDTTAGGKKRESEKLSKKRSTFCKTLNIEERFFFFVFFFCVLFLLIDL